MKFEEKLNLLKSLYNKKDLFSDDYQWQSLQINNSDGKQFTIVNIGREGFENTQNEIYVFSQNLKEALKKDVKILVDSIEKEFTNDE